MGVPLAQSPAPFAPPDSRNPSAVVGSPGTVQYLFKNIILIFLFILSTYSNVSPSLGSPFVLLDSWVYGAFERLGALSL